MKAPASPSAPSRWPTRVLLAVAAAALAFVILERCPAARVSGWIRASGGDGGDFALQPATCFDGGHWGFEGVWVAPELGEQGGRRGFLGGLRIVRVASGLVAYIEDPQSCQGFDCSEHRIDPAHCDPYHVVLVETRFGLRRAGHARMRCQHPALGRLEVDVTFDGCASVPVGGEP